MNNPLTPTPPATLSPQFVELLVDLHTQITADGGLVIRKGDATHIALQSLLGKAGALHLKRRRPLDKAKWTNEEWADEIAGNCSAVFRASLVQALQRTDVTQNAQMA